MRNMASGESISSLSPGMEGRGSGAGCCNLVAHFIHNDNIICLESAMLQWTQPWLEAHVIPSRFQSHTNPSCTSLDCSAHQWQDIDHGSKAVFQEHVNHSDTSGCFFLSKLPFDLSVFDGWCRVQRRWENIPTRIYCCCAAFRICLLPAWWRWERMKQKNNCSESKIYIKSGTRCFHFQIPLK